jgi:ribose transport system permease protein
MSAVAVAANRVRRGGGGRLFAGEGGLLAVILVFALFMTFASPDFLTRPNLTNVLYASTIIAVVALGQTFVILVGAIDLSVGAVMALTSVLASGLSVKSGLPPVVGIVAALGVGVLVGLINGLSVVKLKVTPLIVTLAMLSIASGLALAYSGGINIAPVPDLYHSIGVAEVFGVPVFIPFVLIVAAVAHTVLTRTRLGRSMYAVGGNEEAARLAGIRADRIIIASFVVSGLAAAIAGLMITARFEAGSPQAGLGSELTVIAAVVIGGASLFGGQGTVLGTLLGVLLLAQVENAINLLGVPLVYNDVVRGTVIFGAATLDVYRRHYVEKQMTRSRRQPTVSQHTDRNEVKSQQMFTKHYEERV